MEVEGWSGARLGGGGEDGTSEEDVASDCFLRAADLGLALSAAVVLCGVSGEEEEEEKQLVKIFRMARIRDGT